MADTAATTDTNPTQASIPAEKALPSPSSQEETVSFQVIYGKQKQEVSRSLDSTVLSLKELISDSTGITPEGQKLVNKGVPLKDDTVTLRQAGIKPGAKLMLIGTPATEVAAAKSLASGQPASGAAGEWDAPVSNEPLSKQAQHAKVLAKGKPEDALPGIVGRQITMPDDMVMLGGLCNAHGTRIRLTMKADTRELWIGSAERTQKVPYSSINKIESYPIEDQPEYSILSLNLGSGKYWVYWVPSQYVASIKIRIIGVHALI